MQLNKKPSVFQAKNDQSLGFHGLGQPGAACSSQEQPGATLSQDRCLLLRQDRCLSSSHLSCLNSKHLSSQQQTSVLADICPASTEDISPVQTAG